MPKDFPRARRVADQIQRELPELIRQEVKDPRVGMLTITEVEVNRDMEFAKVFFTTWAVRPNMMPACRACSVPAVFCARSCRTACNCAWCPNSASSTTNRSNTAWQLTHLIESAIAEDAKHPKDE